MRCKGQKTHHDKIGTGIVHPNSSTTIVLGHVFLDCKVVCAVLVGKEKHVSKQTV